MTILHSRSLSYDDVNLVGQPQYDPNAPKSRKDVGVEINRVIVSPMSAVVGREFAIEAVQLGLSICIPRYRDIEKQKEIVHMASGFRFRRSQGDFPMVYAAVGLNDWDRIHRLDYCYLLVDVANGYLYEVRKFVEKLQSNRFIVMVGNVHTKEGFNLYKDCAVRVNLSSGSACKTKDMTGYTRGQITEIDEVYRGRQSNSNSKIIADGGIRDPGCAAKAFGAGADYIMMGGYFKAAKEAQNIIDGEYSYWGEASTKAQILHYGEKRRHAEGRELSIDPADVKPLSELVDDLWGGLSSAVTYSGHNSLTQFIGEGVFEIKG
jgi:IMP dehydrogenase/GMP reductase